MLGTDEVYFQPAWDAGTGNEGSYLYSGISYPCFIMERTGAFQPRANDRNYFFRPGYQVTYINQDEPDPEMLQTILEHFGHCEYQKHFVADHLHHDVFMIYY